MTPSRKKISISMKYKESLAIVPATCPNSLSLLKSDLGHHLSKMITMNDYIIYKIQTIITLKCTP